MVGALGFLSESPLDGLLGVITDVVDPEKNHRIYIGTVSVGSVTFHCHSAVHEKQVRLMCLGLKGFTAYNADILVSLLQCSSCASTAVSRKCIASNSGTLLFLEAGPRSFSSSKSPGPACLEALL